MALTLRTQLPVEEAARSYNSRVITTIALVGIWTAALTVFIVFWMLGRIVWLAFVAALPTSLITLLVLNSLWEKGRRNEWIVGALVLSTPLYLSKKLSSVFFIICFPL